MLESVKNVYPIAAKKLDDRGFTIADSTNKNRLFKYIQMHNE